MTLVTEDELDHIVLEMDCVTGQVSLVGGPPPSETSWLPEVIRAIRAGETLFCSLRGDVIEMRIQPETLWYRLTGDLDDFGGEVAVRCTATGKDWADEVL